MDLSQVYWAYYVICEIDENKLSEIETRDICYYYRSFEVSFEGRFWFGEVFLDFAILFVILAFFVLNNPHDCYMCIGKDPERIYSAH